MTLGIVLQVLFWISIAVILWAYVGYFLATWLMSRIYPKPVHKENWFPQVSLIITAYNEASRIGKKIGNSLDLEYPRDKLEIIVVSDASTDATESIVKTFADQGVKLLAIPVRHGKHYAQGRGIQAAVSDIVVLTDATTYLEKDALSKIIRSYADPTVGCVSGEDRVDSPDGDVVGEGAYVKYEMKLRSFENLAGSLVGASGCFFSVRKSLCSAWIDDMSSDFYIPIVARMNGLRAVVDHEAIGNYRVVSDHSKEFGRKVRTVVHGLEVLFRFRRIMNPFKYGGYAIQMISHKLCRWLVPFAMIIALVTNALLAAHCTFFQVILAVQVIMYLLALAAYIIPPLQKSGPFKIPLFFVLVNLSVLVAWYKYLTGYKYVVWDATKR
ncbi:MAG TPA: glycosyltransferase family 2 protein [Candidatus Acidoferrum sp.]|nr:glycosyltransferase family 2 protein [Candidatus Acidoferrum sp.]